MTEGTDRLRVLIANERLDRLALLATVLEGLGHDVVGRCVSVAEVAALTAHERPDVAFVGLGDSSEHALGLVSGIAGESYCPVIAILPAFDSDWVAEAAKRGVFAYVLETRADELQGAIDITLHRFAELTSLRGAIDRRAADDGKEKEAASLRQRHALELHDSVVQGLVTAQLAHDLGHQDESRVALLATLERAKGIVSRSLTELEADGHSTRGLIRDAASRHVDG